MYNFKFADIGEGIHEGRILEWNYKVGDMAKEGETLVVIETDKVNAEIPLPVDGKIIKLGPAVGETVEVGDILAIIDDGNSSEDIKTQEDKSEEAGVVGELEVSEEVIGSYASSEPVELGNKKVLATPVARKFANDLGVDITKVIGTGEHGRVLKSDIEEHTKKSEVQTTTAKPLEVPKLNVSQEDKREKISSLRRSVVKAMTLSKQVVPHTTLMDELDVTDLVSFRDFYKGKAKDMGIKLTYMAFIIKALTKAIKQFPVFNSVYDAENEEIVYKGHINVGIAVDTPDGLIVPNIKDADTLSLFETAKQVESLANLAKERKIQLKDLQSGTISITNFGAFDALSGTPIIKYPEVAILGIGKITKKPVVKDNEIVVGDILPLSLTFDHRIIDGADGGRFMILFKKYLKDPMLLLMD